MSMIDDVSGRRWGDVRCCEIPPQIAIDEGDCIDGGFVDALSSVEWLFFSGQTALSPKEICNNQPSNWGRESGGSGLYSAGLMNERER